MNETLGTLRANGGNDQTLVLMVYDARGNGGGAICPTLTGDHQSRVTDYTAVVVVKDENSGLEWRGNNADADRP